jgi:hypothetical protein
VSEPDLQAFVRLFDLLGLDPADWREDVVKLLLAVGTGAVSR